MGQVAFICVPTPNCGLAAWDADSPIVMTSFDNREAGVTLVHAVDWRRRDVVWQRRVLGRPYPPRLTAAGTLWIANCSPKGVVMMELNSAGDKVDSIRLESDPIEALGAYVVLPDGIVALWLPAAPGRVPSPNRRDRLARWLSTERGRTDRQGRHARLVRHDKDGATRWSTSLPLTDLTFFKSETLVGKNKGHVEPRPLTPTKVESGRDPLLISASRVAATVACSDSGLAVTFFVALATGRLLGTTAPGPSYLKAIARPGEFLLGYQGYGDFRTAHHDATGAVTREWPTHAQMLIDAHGTISGPESENISPSRSHFVRFGSDSALRRGPALSGYHTAYPALDDNGTAVFWRDGALCAVDADMQMRELSVWGRGANAIPGRVLLLGDGHVAFTLNSQLVVHREPGLGSLNEGVWPCGEGGLRGNPVAFFQDS